MFYNNIRVEDIRNTFRQLLAENKETEIINASFIADEETIFGEVNQDYVERELKWYKSRSCNLNDFPGGAPELWRKVANKDGWVNSNYGRRVWSHEFGCQFEKAYDELMKNKETRRAVIVYMPLNVHEIATEYKKNDFICTYSSQFIIRENQMHMIVNMRSSDAVYGYKNDRPWHMYIFDEMYNKVFPYYSYVFKGKLFWNAGSLHVYPKQHNLIKGNIQ